MADQLPFGRFTSNKEITVIRTTTDFAKAFRAARRVSTPLIAVRTPDPASSVQLVLSTLNGACDETAALQWDAIRGLVGVNEAGKRQASAILGEADGTSVGPDAVLAIGEKLSEDSILSCQTRTGITEMPRWLRESGICETYIRRAGARSFY
jgi:hypothetical protein